MRDEAETQQSTPQVENEEDADLHDTKCDRKSCGATNRKRYRVDDQVRIDGNLDRLLHRCHIVREDERRLGVFTLQAVLALVNQLALGAILARLHHIVAARSSSETIMIGRFVRSAPAAETRPFEIQLSAFFLRTSIEF